MSTTTTPQVLEPQVAVVRLQELLDYLLSEPDDGKDVRQKLQAASACSIVQSLTADPQAATLKTNLLALTTPSSPPKLLSPEVLAIKQIVQKFWF